MDHVEFLYSRVCALVPGLFCGFDVYSGIMGGIPAARYREQVMSESHEATEAGDSKDPSSDLYPFRTPNRGMSLVSSGPPTTTHV